MRTPAWFTPALTAMLLWGLWGMFQKLATNQMPPRAVYLFGTAGALLVVMYVLASSEYPINTDREGIFFAILAGVCSSLGGLLFLKAVSRGEASVVVTFTALYPVITIILAVTLLGEAMTMKQAAGIVLALISLLLLAT